MILIDAAIGFVAGFLAAIVLLVVLGLLLVRSLVRKALLGTAGNVRILKARRNEEPGNNTE